MTSGMTPKKREVHPNNVGRRGPALGDCFDRSLLPMWAQSHLKGSRGEFGGGGGRSADLYTRWETISLF